MRPKASGAAAVIDSKGGIRANRVGPFRQSEHEQSLVAPAKLRIRRSEVRQTRVPPRTLVAVHSSLILSWLDAAGGRQENGC